MAHRQLTIGSLFSGIGGIELGLERAGLGPTLWQVEIDPFARSVLARHWPNVRRYDDVRALDVSALAPVDVLCGGFPCQDVSLGNNRGARGLDGTRSGLWFEYARVIEGLCLRGVRPRYIVVENVPALRKRGLDQVLGDLASCGYDAVWDGLHATAFGAHHVRDRLFVVAWPASDAVRDPLRLGAERREWPGWRVRAPVGGDPEPLVDGEVDGWSARPSMVRVDDGLPPGLGGAGRAERAGRTRADKDRWRVLGNAVVPQVAEYLGWSIRQHAGL